MGRTRNLETSTWRILTRFGAEEFIHPIGKAGFWLDEINWVAGELADKLAEWICESSFGWGEWRVLPDDWTPPTPLPGRQVVSVHFADDGGLPLWAGGAHAPWLAARLSPELVAELHAWQTLGEQLAEDADEGPAADIPTPVGPYASRVKYVTEQQVLAREAERRLAAADAHMARRQWVDALEPLRDGLVERLRTELSPDYEVRTPPRVQ